MFCFFSCIRLLMYLIVWSIAGHGPLQVLVECLRPLLIEYNVTAYFCGHDHTMQHLHEDDSSVEYFVNGAGHDTNPSKKHVVSVSIWHTVLCYVLS